MKGSDLVGAVVTSVVWGLTFIGIKYGVEEAPPFLLTALRFTFAALPLAFFVKPPAAPASRIALYGAIIGVGQFGLLFLGVREGMPVGLASLVIQSQVYFTILFAAVALGERPTREQWIGGAVALAGMVVIASTRWGGASLRPFALTLGAAVCWGVGNVVGKRIGRVDALSFVVWTSLVAPLPMAALSWWLEPQRTLAALTHPSLKLALSVAGIAYGGTVLAYGLWARLLAKYPTAVVAPFALLVPVVGMISARLLFDEPTTPAELAGAALVMAGLAVNVLGARLRATSRRRIAA
ncbi:MAG: EamA family transporter [Pseudomonadota bacterium]|nr:EamA family transporter [Pseudomonadota bacterium]